MERASAWKRAASLEKRRADSSSVRAGAGLEPVARMAFLTSGCSSVAFSAFCRQDTVAAGVSLRTMRPAQVAYSKSLSCLPSPNAGTSVALVKDEHGLYQFADPTWEALSVGQKLMIRVGPDNERTLKIKLHRIRALLLGKAVILHGSAPAAHGG